MLHYIKKIPNTNPVIVHSDLLLFGKKILTKKNKLKELLLSHFKNGIFIPSFYLGKKKIIRFDKSEHTMGLLTKIFIIDKKIKRTLNPIHSYLYGNIKLNPKMCMNSSFGHKSLFEYFYQKNMIWINLGAENNAGFTIFHHAEDICNVRYRKRVFFTRKIFYKKKIQIKFFYFARKKEIKYDFDKVVKIMIKKQILKEITLKNKYKITYGESAKIIDFLILKITKNENFLLKKKYK